MMIRIIIPLAVVALALSFVVFRWLEKPGKEISKASASEQVTKQKPVKFPVEEKLPSGEERPEKMQSTSMRRVKKEPNKTKKKYKYFAHIGHVTPERLAKIKEALASAPAPVMIISKPQENAIPFESASEALSFVVRKFGMGFIPRRYVEDEKMYYFSGGLLPKKVSDFSTGIAVDKKSRAIIGWDIRKKGNVP